MAASKPPASRMRAGVVNTWLPMIFSPSMVSKSATGAALARVTAPP